MTNYWIAHENLYLGMRMTFKRSKFVNNTDEITRRVIPEFREAYYNKAGR